MIESGEQARLTASLPRLTPIDEAAVYGDISRSWMIAGGYTEGAGPGNPYPATVQTGLDTLNVARVGGQYTHLFNGNIEVNVSAAVAYGFGIVLYFTAEREPAWWAGAIVVAGFATGAILLRHQFAALVVTLFLFAIAAGFTVATLKTAWIAHPILRYAASGVTVAGFVELREESQHTDRFVLRVDRIDGNRIDDKPQRVRLSVRRGMAPPAGAFIEVKAQLDPPLQPLRSLLRPLRSLPRPLRSLLRHRQFPCATGPDALFAPGSATGCKVRDGLNFGRRPADPGY